MKHNFPLQQDCEIFLFEKSERARTELKNVIYGAASFLSRDREIIIKIFRNFCLRGNTVQKLRFSLYLNRFTRDGEVMQELHTL